MAFRRGRRSCWVMHPRRAVWLRRWMAAARVWALTALIVSGGKAFAHNLTGDAAHPHYYRTVKPPEQIHPLVLAASLALVVDSRPLHPAPFLAFAPRVT